MQLTRILDDFLDYRSYVSHTLCQHRLFLGLSSPANARERLCDAYVWPLVHDEAKLLCDMMGALYGIVVSTHPELKSVVSKIRGTLREMDTRQVELVKSNDDSAFESFCSLAHQLHDQLKEIYAAIKNRPPDFSKSATLQSLEYKTHDQWLCLTSDHIGKCLAPTIRFLLLDEDIKSKPEQYCRFWSQSSQGYLLTRKAIVAAAMDDVPVENLVPIRKIQKLLRGIESVVSCWAPLISEDDRPELIDKVIRAEGFHNRLALLACLEGEVASL